MTGIKRTDRIRNGKKREQHDVCKKVNEKINKRIMNGMNKMNGWMRIDWWKICLRVS